MADPTISHGWTTAEPDAGKDVDADNLNDHQITGFGAAVSAIVDPAVATEAAARATADTAAIATAAADATTKVAAEAVLARNADNLISGTVADARIASTIARDSEVTTAVAAEATLARNADNLTSGTVADARIASTIARDSEVTSAITTHEAAGDPHPGYLTAAEGAAAYDAIGAAAAAQAASQPLDSDLTAFAGLAIAADKLPYGTGSHTLGLADFTAAGRALVDDAAASDQRTTLGLGTLATQSGTFSGTSSGTNTGDQSLPTRASLGLDTTDSPQFAGLNVGAATDTTITRSGAGDVAVEGNALYRAGGTDVPVADGGTGSSTAAGAATNLGLGTGDSPQHAAVNIGHASDTTLDRASAGVLQVEGNRIFAVGGVDVPVADGGTGASTAAGARTNLGLVPGTDVASLTAGVVPIAQLATGTPTGAKFIRDDGTLQTPASGGITTVDKDIGADFTSGSGSAWTDITGLTGISLAAGTYIAICDIESLNAVSYGPVFRITDGTTIFAQMGVLVSNPVTAAASTHHTFTSKPFVLSGSATAKVQYFSDTAFTIKRYPARGASSTAEATHITFMKIA